MDITRILEADHRKAEDLLQSLSRRAGDARMSDIAALSDALRDHMELEETVMYPVLKEVFGLEALQEANTEHELARRALADLVRLAPDEPGFGAALSAFEACLAHHVGEEETDVFPALRTNKDAMSAMAEPFAQKRRALGIE